MSSTDRFRDFHWTSKDGLRLFARDYPAADDDAKLPVICLHGLTRNSKDFEDIAPLIAATGRRVIVPDVRGRGLSDHDPQPTNYQPRIYARDAVEMMDLLDIERAVFLGTSMGGLITMTLMAMRPKAVSAAILNDVGPSIAPEGIARIKGYAGKLADIRDWNDAADYVRRTNGVAFPDYADKDWSRFARRTFREGRDGRPELDYDPAISIALARPPSRFAFWITGLLFKRLARNRPVLLVRGALSDVITSDIADRMQRMAPGLQRAEVPNVGHAPMLAEPVAVDAITRFLRTVP
jgi:pimeloyl-ACP methyl ester carboxylesterase